MSTTAGSTWGSTATLASANRSYPSAAARSGRAGVAFIGAEPSFRTWNGPGVRPSRSRAWTTSGSSTCSAPLWCWPASMGAGLGYSGCVQLCDVYRDGTHLETQYAETPDGWIELVRRSPAPDRRRVSTACRPTTASRSSPRPRPAATSRSTAGGPARRRHASTTGRSTSRSGPAWLRPDSRRLPRVWRPPRDGGSASEPLEGAEPHGFPRPRCVVPTRGSASVRRSSARSASTATWTSRASRPGSPGRGREREGGPCRRGRPRPRPGPRPSAGIEQGRPLPIRRGTAGRDVQVDLAERHEVPAARQPRSDELPVQARPHHDLRAQEPARRSPAATKWSSSGATALTSGRGEIGSVSAKQKSRRAR